MWPVTTGTAAAVLGVSPPKLRRWINEKRFDHIDGMTWDRQPGYERKRLFTREWVAGVASEIGAAPDFTVVEGPEAN